MNQVSRKERLKLLAKKNVVAVGIGFKTVRGRKTKDSAVVCSVIKKVEPETLSRKDLIPKSVEGMLTDVVETGEIEALKLRTDRWRPAPGGVSIGHEQITAGTLGCLVKKGNLVYILSNNHVLANSNNAAVGDSILQPGKADGGQSFKDRIAILAEFEPISFVGGDEGCGISKAVASVLNAVASVLRRKSRLSTYDSDVKMNLMDAALAQPLSETDVKKEILEIGMPTGPLEGELGMAIQKSGRTTELTKGEIIQTDVMVTVQYGAGKTAIFEKQFMAGEMCAGGDSGSVVLDMNKNLIGLLFAGSETTTIINPIAFVFDRFEINL